MQAKNKKFDIIIAGGGTSGVSCAYNAAKNGLKTLLIEENSYLGGSITSSLVIPAMKTSDNSINNDFYNILYKKLCTMNGAITYGDGNKGWFNPELTKIALEMILCEVGVEICYEHIIDKINVKNNKILSTNIVSLYNDNFIQKNNELSGYIETSYLVDATGDAKICKKLNCKFLKNLKNETQPSSLRFIMSGIDTKKFSKWLMNYDTNRDVTTSYKINNIDYMSTAYTWDENMQWALKPLFIKAIANNDLKDSDTNYFQLFSVAGTKDSIAFNAPRLIDEDLSRTNSYIKAREMIYRLSKFCIKYLPGFKDGYISSIAHKLGVRASYRVEGEYIYTIDDLLSGKTFENPVVISNYPVDIHSKKKNSSTLQKVYKEYQLPFEALKVKNFDNLYVIGRCISADYKAQGALRIIPSCFSMGEGLIKQLIKDKP